MSLLEVPLFPTPTVLFPGTVIPLRVTEGPLHAAIEHCVETDTPFGVVLVDMLDSGQAVLSEVGTLAAVHDHTVADDGSIEAVGIGTDRFRILRIVRDSPFIAAEVAKLADERADLNDRPVREALEDLSARFRTYAGLALPRLPETVEVQFPSDPTARLNLICSAMMVPLRQKQRLLEENSTARRIEIALSILQREICELDALRAAIAILRGEDDVSFPLGLN